MQISNSIKELSVAINKAQSELKKAKKESKNPHFRSTYADLESVWDACREALNKNGLSVVQTVGALASDGRPTLTTMLLHTSGEYVYDTAILPTVKAGPQDLGSCLTYMKRYGLAALVGVCDSDDDAEAAEGRGVQAGASNVKSNTAPSGPQVFSTTAGEPPPLPPHAPKPLSQNQLRRLYAMASANGWNSPYVDAYVNKNYQKSPSKMNYKEYQFVCESLAKFKPTEKDKEELKPFLKSPTSEFERVIKEKLSAPMISDVPREEELPF